MHSTIIYFTNIARKYNGGLEQETMELVLGIILEEEEEEEDGFHQCADQYDQLGNTSYTIINKDKVLRLMFEFD